MTQHNDRAAMTFASYPMVHRWPVSLMAIIGLCTAVEAVLILSDLGLLAGGQLRTEAYQYGGFWAGLLGDWRPNYAAQPYLMFLTYGFLHAGVFHLLVNMVTLVSLGLPVIRRIGEKKFLVLYLLSMLGGGAGFAALSDSYQPMIGASGALFGLAGALAAWEYVDRYSARLQLWPVVQLVAILLILNLVLWWAMSGLLAWQTHLGGFATGWVLALVLDPRARPIG